MAAELAKGPVLVVLELLGEPGRSELITGSSARFRVTAEAAQLLTVEVGETVSAEHHDREPALQIRQLVELALGRQRVAVPCASG